MINAGCQSASAAKGTVNVGLEIGLETILRLVAGVKDFALGDRDWNRTTQESTWVSGL